MEFSNIHMQKMVKKTEFETYSEAENYLNSMGFEKDVIDPINGFRFKNDFGYGYLKRMSSGCWEFFDFSDKLDYIYNFIRENPMKKTAFIKMLIDLNKGGSVDYYEIEVIKILDNVIRVLNRHDDLLNMHDDLRQLYVSLSRRFREIKGL